MEDNKKNDSILTVCNNDSLIFISKAKCSYFIYDESKTSTKIPNLTVTETLLLGAMPIFCICTVVLQGLLFVRGCKILQKFNKLFWCRNFLVYHFFQCYTDGTLDTRKKV